MLLVLESLTRFLEAARRNKEAAVAPLPRRRFSARFADRHAANSQWALPLRRFARSLARSLVAADVCRYLPKLRVAGTRSK